MELIKDKKRMYMDNKWGKLSPTYHDHVCLITKIFVTKSYNFIIKIIDKYYINKSSKNNTN